MIAYFAESKLPEFIDSTICIVGGHDESIIDAWLTEADYIVCVNAHYKRQGITPDIYFGSSYELAMPNEKVPYAFVCRSENLDTWSKHANNLFSFCRDRTAKPKPDARDEWLNVFQHEINGNPLSGMIALRWFTLQCAKKIYLCGMDFYHDANIKIIDYFWPHNIRQESLWARELWRTHTRLHYSPHLMGVLDLVGEEKGQMFRDDIDRAWAGFTPGGF
jgi:hypothetical protein